MDHEVSCVTSLNLSLGDHGFPTNHLIYLHDEEQEQEQEQLERKSILKWDRCVPCLKLGLGRDQERHPDPINWIPQASNSTVNTISSFSKSTSIKRERDGGSQEVEKVLSKAVIEIDQDESEGRGARKKLRLTNEQTLVLEESFKQHDTLNRKQKQALATSLVLQQRQVEVWFQNRRARTKLKQNEVDCTLLKKCCEALKSDNKRLEKEIQELKAIRTTISVPPQFNIQFPAASHSMCLSCEKIVSRCVSGGGGRR
ncbi:unnamed protein product [Lactuca virosa]|uniref:Homeobox domain-containing protein n=1 Tax=Lactuca virosa TaxID=75947 RepID=A0AAU9P1W3_9ASTR|nr:unnamed protein product [Lactuca virosa]